MSSQSTSETCFQSRTRTLSGLGVLLGALSRPSSKRKNPRAQTNMSGPFETTAKRSRPSSRRSAKMYSMFWMIPLFPKRNQESPKCSTTKCTHVLIIAPESRDTQFSSLIRRVNRKGDYHRYLAEFASGEKRKVAATAAHDAYKV